MAWNSADEKELGMFIAKNSLRESSHLPFMVAYDRYNPLVTLHIQSRVAIDQIDHVHEQVWKRAWIGAVDFVKSDLTYREWLLSIADELIQDQLKRIRASEQKTAMPPQSPSWLWFLDQHKLGALFSAVGALSQDYHNVLRAASLGFSSKEVQTAFRIDHERIEKWFMSATSQVQKQIGSNETLVVSSTPEDDSAIGQWMQKILLSGSMKQWVAELWAMQQIETTQSVDSRLDFSKWLEGKQETLTQSGLSTISRKDLQRLLQRPWLLFELQRFLLTQQSEGWLEQEMENPVNNESELQRTRVALMLGPDAVRLNRDAGHIHLMPWWKKRSAVVAATVLLLGAFVFGVLIQKQPERNTNQWNWQIDMPASEMNDSQEYLTALAMSAEGWFNTQSSDAATLVRQLSNLQSNLEYLKSTALPRLKTADQKWLSERLSEWNTKREELESKVRINPEATRIEADKLVTEIISLLYQRAAISSST